MSIGQESDDRSSGFFIPYRYKAAVRPISYPACAAILAEQANEFGQFIAQIELYADAFERFGGDAPAPRFEQDWFARLDLAACYTFIRERQPKKLVEVGSGHSTRVIARARADSGHQMSITCIDPKPRARFLDLDVEHEAALATDIGFELFDTLKAGDVLFVDSSHLAQPGTDVDYLLNVVVPRLASGTLVHIHDVFLPDRYPQAWDWRGYNEQSVVAPMLTGRGFKPLFSSHYVLHHTNLIARDGLIANLPLVAGALETSLWLLKQSDAIR